MEFINKILDLTFRSRKFMKLFYYGIFGILTTVINLAIFWVLEKAGIQYAINATLAWVVAVLFAYLTNRKLVFDSTAKGIKEKLIELFRFYLGRVATLLLNIFGLFIMVTLCKLDEMFSQIIMNILVIIANYFFSKLTIITHKNEIAEKSEISDEE